MRTCLIHHIDITMGRAHVVSRPVPSDPALALDSPMVMLADGWTARLQAAPVGSRFFDMFCRRVPMSTCILCLDPRLSTHLWRHACDMPSLVANLPSQPAATPWIASALRLDQIENAPEIGLVADLLTHELALTARLLAEASLAA